MKPISNKWSDASREMLCDMYGMYSPDEIAGRITTQFGIEFSERSVLNEASRLGIRAEDNLGYLSVTFAAREIGIHYATLFTHIKRHGIKTKGRGKYRFLTPDQFEELKAFYNVPAEPTIGIREAAQRLNYHRSYINDLIHNGTIRATKRGCYWRIPVNEIDRILSARKMQA